MRFYTFRTLVLVTCLTGCTVDPSSQAVIDSFKQFQTSTASNKSSLKFDPNFNFLRIQINQREVFMVQGYVDKSPDGSIEVWYSALGEVLRLRDGRLMGATIYNDKEWLSVSFSSLPRWEQIDKPFTFVRNRDVSPGYQYGIKETMLIKPITPPKNSNLQLIQPSTLTWFEERAEHADALPPTRYGVNMTATPQVIYAEQCISTTLCFSWQRWASAKESTH